VGYRFLSAEGLSWPWPSLEWVVDLSPEEAWLHQVAKLSLGETRMSIWRNKNFVFLSSSFGDDKRYEDDDNLFLLVLLQNTDIKYVCITLWYHVYNLHFVRSIALLLQLRYLTSGGRVYLLCTHTIRRQSTDTYELRKG